MQVRQATVADGEAVRAVALAAFAEAEARVVSQVAVSLLAEESSPPILTLVAEVDGAVVGFVAYSPLTMPEGWQALVLPGGTAATTPVCVECARSLCDASLW